MRKIVISGYYGFNNSGDDAMTETFAKYCIKNKINVTVLSKNPEETEKKFKIKAINRNNPIKIIKAIKNSDILVSGGGTLLQDITKVISIWYYLAILWLGIILRKEVYILFQGIGPINNKFNIWLTRKTLPKLDKVILRDNKALEELKRLQIDTKNVIVASDLVFALDVPSQKESETLIKKYIIDYDKNKVYLGVSLRPWKNENNYVLFAKLFDRISKELNVNIVFFPFHAKQDYKFTCKVISKIKSKCYMIFDNFLPSQTIGMMSLMKLNIGIRLHSLIFSAIARVPLIGISYDPKIDGFLNELGLKAICEYDNLDEEKIKEEVNKVLLGEYDYSVFEKINHNKELVDTILDDVIGGKYAKD